MMRGALHYPLVVLAVPALLAPSAAIAQETEEGQDLRQAIEELRRAILVRDDVIKNLLARIEVLEQMAADAETGTETGAEAAAPAGMAASPISPAVPASSSPTVTAEAVPELTEDERREQEQLVRTAFERTLIERGGLLLPPGTVELEPAFTYTHSSSDNIVIDGFSILPVLVVGDIVSERIRRDSIQAALTARVGLLPDLQVEVRVPYGYQRQQTFAANNEQTTLSRTALGDVELAVSSQLLRGGGWAPDLLASLRWKTTTGGSPFDDAERLSLGSGYDSLSGSLTAVKVSDPVVLFGNLSYARNLAMEEEIGRFNPGDSIGVQLGMAIALNLDTAINFGYEQRFANASRLDDEKVPGSSFTTGTFMVGSSYALRSGLSFDFSLGIGVTEDSPDVQVTFSTPFRLHF